MTWRKTHQAKAIKGGCLSQSVSSERAGPDLCPDNRQKVDETESENENDEVESGNEGDDSDVTIDEGQ